jgi:hypothetical protein
MQARKSSRPDGRCKVVSVYFSPLIDPIDHFDPAPIRARTAMTTLSGGRMSKATFAIGYFPSPFGRGLLSLSDLSETETLLPSILATFTQTELTGIQPGC